MQVVRSLKQIGNSKGIVMTRDMLDHLGVTEAVEVTLEKGRIVITAPAEGAVPARRPPRRRQTFEDAMTSTFAQYDPALQRLAEAPPVNGKDSSSNGSDGLSG